MRDTQPVLACDLGALNADERGRRASLASRVMGQFREVRGLSDGYAACLDSEPALARDALDWLLLERRCCPFLNLELSLETSSGALWLRFRGGPGVKEFLTAAGLKEFPPKNEAKLRGM